MTGKKSLHIECYNESQNSVEYDFDKLFWDDCCDKLLILLILILFVI